MKNHNTHGCLPARGTIANNKENVSGDASNVICAKSSSDISEANFTAGKPARGGVKAATRKGLRQNSVFVLGKNRKALTPCTPARARKLLSNGKAAVLRHYPFTIILKNEIENPVSQETTVKINPGSKETGVVIVHKAQNRVLFAMVLVHRGAQIAFDLTSRRALRRGKKNRKTRYRKVRFLNRKKPTGWLAPSLMHRVHTIETQLLRLRRTCNVASLSTEVVKFDMQKMLNPEISGVEYQQGALQGYEVREYLLEKFGRACVYCGAEGVPLEVEHIKPKSKGGSNRVSNLTIACRKCNEKKGSKDISVFLKDKPELLKKILANAKAPLKDAAAVNSTRNALLSLLQEHDLTVETGSGAETKFNRRKNGYKKEHWIDAACVGPSGNTVSLNENMTPLIVKCTGHGSRQFCITDKYGFPKSHKTNKREFFGFKTGDIVVASVPSGKKSGKHKGRVSVRSTGSFKLKTKNGILVDGINYKHFRIIQRKDGYEYN